MKLAVPIESHFSRVGMIQWKKAASRLTHVGHWPYN